jgi:hypothetical protein
MTIIDGFLETNPKEIEDAVDEARRDTRYQVTDYPVELIVSKFRESPHDAGDIYIPDYQRKLRWSEKAMSYFIESVILRIPVPPIFLYEVGGKLEVVDGSQRVRTLAQFANDEFALQDIEKLDILRGFRCSQLPDAVRKRFLNTAIRSFVLDEGTDQTTRVELFRRLNTTGKKLHDAEIRKGAYQGVFLDLIIECADSELFKTLTPRMTAASDVNSERQELVTRFFIYGDHYQAFTHDVQKFLDRHLLEMNKIATPHLINTMRAEFVATMQFISNHYPHAFYRTDKSKILPRVRFEAVAVGTCLALRQTHNLHTADLTWLRGEELGKLVRTDASNSGPRLRDRIQFVRDRLVNG